MQKDLKEITKKVISTGAHIFYSFEDQKIYIDNVIAYIACAIEQDHHVMVIENDRIMPLIEKEINSSFSEEQIDMIHTVNNYDFYCYRGNFHKDTILSYLKNMIAPYLEKGIPIRTWAHVEWRDQEEIFHTIGEYEHEADQLLRDTNFITVCAYDTNRVPKSLKDILLDCHDYFMTDETISYINKEKTQVN
jgi:hypothetical protein